jgi:hypothetical protein
VPEKKNQPSLYLAKLSFQNEEDITTLSDKQKQRGFITHGAVL